MLEQVPGNRYAPNRNDSLYIRRATELSARKGQFI